MEDMIKTSSKSGLVSIPGNLLGKYSDVGYALAVAGFEAKQGGYDECCLIYVAQLPRQIEWSVIAVPDGESFHFWRRAILSIRVKSSGWGSIEDEDARIDEEVADTYGCYMADRDARLQADREMASKLGKFTVDDVWEAAETGKFPPGMTAQHLVDTWYEPLLTNCHIQIILAHSALHLAASNGHFPPGTTFADLLVFQGKDCEDCVDWLFRQRSPITFPSGTTAQALARVSNARFGDYLNRSAYFGDLPPGTTTADLSKIKQLNITDDHIMKELPFKNYAAPLHFAVAKGKLLPGTTANELKLSTENGPSPWDLALHYFSTSWLTHHCVQNILACPELCECLQPDDDDNHQKICDELLAHPKLKQEQALRDQIAQYPLLCGKML